MSISLYIHIPVCSVKCSYCDFFSVPYSSFSETSIKSLLDAILIESSLRLKAAGPCTIESVFIGGGTPSVLPPVLLENFLVRLNDIVSKSLDDGAEFTIEANPESCSGSFLDVIADCGVNRLSTGIQSFNQAFLKRIGRGHIASDIFKKAVRIRKDWHGALSFDIITESPELCLQDLRKACSIRPDHLSVYALTIEQETPLGESAAAGSFIPVSDDQYAETISCAVNFLQKAGYDRYEVSNYSLMGKGDSRCRHNLRYWNMQSYAGCGPGAVSSFYRDGRGERFTNTRDISRYTTSIHSAGDSIPGSIQKLEILRDFDYIFEHYMTGMRLCSGMDTEIFFRRFGCTPVSLIRDTVSRWSSEGYSDPADGTLNSKGMMLLDSYLSDIWDELKKNEKKSKNIFNDDFRI